MVFVKVRETYDLHTKANKMTVIGIHTPKSEILKRNFPGLLMQCKAYRPVSCDVRVACASLQSLDPLQVGTSSTDIAPEDVFNPILYKAMSNFGMSQLEARINALRGETGNLEVDGDSAFADVDSVTGIAGDEFNIYYGLLSNAHDWKHASPQAGLEMRGLKPLVYEMLYNVGDNHYQDNGAGVDTQYEGFTNTGAVSAYNVGAVRGNAKPMPFINCTAYQGISTATTSADPGFHVNDTQYPIKNCQTYVPSLMVMCGCIIVPPSRLHEFFYRMVVEWTIEFSMIRPISEITDWLGLGRIGAAQHYMNYNYSSTKEAVTGSPDTMLEQDSCMVSSNVDINKVM